MKEDFNFKNSIVENYHDEVQPKFTEDKWSSYLAYTQKKERKNRLLLIILPLGLLLGFSGYYLWTNSSGSNDHFERINAYDQNVVAAQPNRISTDASSDKLKTGMEKAHHPSHPIDIPHVPLGENDGTSTDISLENVARPNLEQEQNVLRSISMSQSLTDQASCRETFRRASASEGIENAHSYIIRKNMRAVPQEIIVHQNRTLDILKPHYPEQLIPPGTNGFLPPVISLVKQKKQTPRNRLWTAALYCGIAMPQKNFATSEQAYQFGSRLSYQLGKIGLSTNLLVQNYSYTATHQTESLGIGVQAPPRTGQTFEKAEVETMNVHYGLGISYDLLKRTRWDLTVGLDYFFYFELIKDTDYFFEGSEKNKSSDDDLISFKNAFKQFSPVNLNCYTSVSRSFGRNGIKLSVEYPIQLSKAEIDLLQQWQFNLGFLYKF